MYVHFTLTFDYITCSFQQKQKRQNCPKAKTKRLNQSGLRVQNNNVTTSTTTTTTTIPTQCRSQRSKAQTKTTTQPDAAIGRIKRSFYSHIHILDYDY